MKFKNYLETISGISIFPMISLAIFFIFFVVLITWTMTVKKERIAELKNTPFDGPTDKTLS